MILKFHWGLASFSVMFFLLVAPLFVLLFGLSCEDLVYPLCILMSIIVLWIFCTLKYISHDLFNFYSLFILAAVLFNGGQALLEVFHLNKSGILDGTFSPKTLVPTLYLVILSLASFHTGGILSLRRTRLPEGDENQQTYNYPPDTSAQALRIVGYILISISVVPAFIVTIDALKIVLSSGYFALYQRDPAAGMASGLAGVKNAMSGFYVSGLLFLLSGSKNRFIVRNVIIVALVVQVCTLMFLGHRRYGTMLLIAGLWVWHRIVRPIPMYKILIGGGILLFVIFPAIKLVRNVEGVSRVNFQFISDAYLSIKSPAVAIIKEMGGSMGTIAHTLKLIPQERPFAMGSTYAYAASTVIPNFFWDLHPAVKYGSLGRWLTMTVAPDTFSIGGGLGYSFIAEAYANFGWLGTPFIMGMIGFTMARLTSWSAGREDYGRIAVVSLCIAIMLFWTRADVTVFSRNLYYYVLPPYIIFLYIRKKLHQRNLAKL